MTFPSPILKIISVVSFNVKKQMDTQFWIKYPKLGETVNAKNIDVSL